MILYNSVCINEVLVHGNFTFVCLLHEVAEQCGCVLQIWRLTVVFDHAVCEERLVLYILATSSFKQIIVSRITSLKPWVPITIFLQSWEKKSRTESLGLRLL